MLSVLRWLFAWSLMIVAFAVAIPAQALMFFCETLGDWADEIIE